MVDPLAEYNMPQYILREFKVVLVVDVDDNDDVGNLVDTVVAIPAPPLPLPTGARDVQARKRLRSKSMS